MSRVTTPSRLQITEHRNGDITVLTLSGQMTVDDGDLAFRAKVNDLVAAGQVKLILDLSGVEYIDSSGIGMLCEKVNSVRQHHGDIKLLKLTRRTQSLLSMLKLTFVFETFETEEAAVKRYAFSASQNPPASV